MRDPDQDRRCQNLLFHPVKPVPVRNRRSLCVWWLGRIIPFPNLNVSVMHLQVRTLLQSCTKLFNHPILPIRFLFSNPDQCNLNRCLCHLTQMSCDITVTFRPITCTTFRSASQKCSSTTLPCTLNICARSSLWICTLGFNFLWLILYSSFNSLTFDDERLVWNFHLNSNYFP